MTHRVPAGPYRTSASPMPLTEADYVQYNLEREAEAVKKATADGFTIVRGNENTLLLDLDTAQAMKQFNSTYEMVDSKFGILHQEFWTSKSGGERRHAKLILKTSLSAAERVALQAIMGSDPKREIFAVTKLGHGIAEPSMLFKPPGAVVSTDNPSWSLNDILF